MSKCEPWLAQHIEEAGGGLTFAQFMGAALYDPTHGYYAVQVGDVGQQGDFSTAATLCPAFGEAIAHWAKVRAAADFPDGDFALIEVGAGNGQLAENFQSAWRAMNGPDVPYFAVETSPRLFSHLTNRAAKHGLQVFANLPLALAQCKGRALIFHNELVDAFPARQLCWDGEDWQEVGVQLIDGELVEGLMPFLDAVDADAPARPNKGQRIFIHPSYHEWLDTELTAWQTGRMLTIDYGAAYPSGECRAYRGQERIEGADIYANSGAQDLTCDINFADVQRWGQARGWETIDRQPQAAFLKAWLPDLKTRVEADKALGFLSDPFGAGGAFQVLEQRINR